MLKDLNLDGDAKRYEAINKWEEIVGPTIAAVTEPERISHGTLVVRVNSSVWKYELTMRKAEILEKVREKIGTVDVKDIQWK
jgi:predicted nucleic acid-binding Zn ribbon protein